MGPLAWPEVTRPSTFVFLVIREESSLYITTYRSVGGAEAVPADRRT